MAIQEHFIHTVVLLPKGAPDMWGDETPAATPSQVPTDARFIFQREMVLDGQGKEIVCVAHVYMDANIPAIVPGDQVLFEGWKYKVVRANRHETEAFTPDRERAHWKVYVV